MRVVEDMLLFARLVELKSFTAVADAEGVSRSLVSKRINRLENHLGVQLITRTTRRLELTEAGRRIYGYCKQLEQTRQAAESAVSEMRRRPQGTLRINAPVTFGQLVLPDIIVGFLDQYPEVRIELSLSDRFVDVIGEGYDLVIRIGRLKDSTLRARRMGSTRLRLYAHRDYLDRHGTPETPGDLRRHNCIIYRYQTPSPGEWTFTGPRGEETVRVGGNFSVDNGVPAYRAAQAGMGIARQPAFVEEAFGDAGMVRLLEDHEPEIGIYALYAATRRPPLTTRAFIDYLGGRLSEASRD